MLGPVDFILKALEVLSIHAIYQYSEKKMFEFLHASTCLKVGFAISKYYFT